MQQQHARATINTRRRHVMKGVVPLARIPAAEIHPFDPASEGGRRDVATTIAKGALHGGQCGRVARPTAIGGPRQRQTKLALSRPPTILIRVGRGAVRPGAGRRAIVARRDTRVASGGRRRWAGGWVHWDHQGTSRTRPRDRTRNANVRAACAQRAVHAVHQEVGSTAAACIAASRSRNGASVHGDSKRQSTVATHCVEKPRASVDTVSVSQRSPTLRPQVVPRRVSNPFRTVDVSIPR